VADLRAYKDQPLLANPLPVAALPTRAELDQAMPDDLVPHAGATLEAEVGGGEDIPNGEYADPPAAEEPPAEEAPAAQAIAALQDRKAGYLAFPPAQEPAPAPAAKRKPRKF